jgi:hypothetical protein
VTIELSDDEAEMLREILEIDRSDLRMEIANTDSQEFRERLKLRERFLDRLLARLGRPVAA